MPEITETTEPDLVTEVEGLLAKVTPGPWGVLPSNNGTLAHVETQEGTTAEQGQGFTVCSIPKKRIHDANLIAAAPELLRRLVEEVKRLKRGEFTPEEFQNLCHNADVQAGFDAFADGCEAYQEKLFGRCRKGTTR